MRTTEIVEITPRGFTRHHRSMADALRAFRDSVVKTLYIVRLDLATQARGLSLGHLWLLLEPALQAGAYYFLISVVFAFQGADTTFAFFFAAITFWRSHAMLVTSAPYFLTSKGHYYIDQNVSLGNAYLELAAQEVLLFMMRLAAFITFIIFAGYSPSWEWLFVLYVAAAQFMFSMALVVWLSMMGTVAKDIGKLVAHVVWLWWFMSPGLYSIRRIPEWAEPIYQMNPFAVLIPSVHSAFLDNEILWAHVRGTTLILLASTVALALGWRMLNRFSYVMVRYV